jgi:hypothetical protein
MDRYEDISPFLAEITRTAEQRIEASAVLR